MPDQMTDKQSIRDRVLRARRELDAHVRAALSTRACAHAVEVLRAYGLPAIVGLYAAAADEVDTSDLAATLVGEGVLTAYPAVGKYGIEYIVSRQRELMPGAFGMLEPRGVATAIEEIDEIGALIIPAVAFDRLGNRLGRGGGHYDRLLARYPGLRVGLVFSLQLVPKVPAEPHDQPVDVVVTEDGVVVDRRG